MVIVQLLVFERNRQLVARDGSGALHQRLHLFLGQGDQQEAVFACVGMKNVGEGGRDDAAKAVVGERPGRMFARGSAAEVLARHQDFCVLVVRVIQDEIRVRLACVRPS